MGFFDWIRGRGERSRTSASYRQALLREPSDADVAWLAAVGTAGDADHARWELRYARRALYLLSAQRDALDDRTASSVAHTLGRLLETDPGIAPERRSVARQQFNARLRAYGDALSRREAEGGRGAAAARALLHFAGRTDPIPGDAVASASEILSRYLLEANDTLRTAFGTAALPEHLPPSTLARRAK